MIFGEHGRGEFVFLASEQASELKARCGHRNVIKIRIESRTREIFIKRVQVITSSLDRRSSLARLPIAKMEKLLLTQTRAKVVKQKKRNDRQMFVAFIAITCEGLEMHPSKGQCGCFRRVELAKTKQMSKIREKCRCKIPPLCGFSTSMFRVVKIPRQ